MTKRLFRKSAAVAALLCFAFGVLAFLMKRGHIHYGYFRVLKSAQHSACRVDMRGALGFNVQVVSDSSSNMARIRGELQVLCDPNTALNIELSPPFEQNARLSTLLQAYAADVSKFLPFTGGGSDLRSVQLSVRVETNSPPFEVWIGYALAGSQAPMAASLSFIDHKAEVERVHLRSEEPDGIVEAGADRPPPRKRVRP